MAQEEERIAQAIVDSSIKIHRTLGNGLLESAYEKCLTYELTQRGFSVATQVVMNVHYEEVDLGPAYRLDMLVNDLVVVELKAVEQILPIHRAQLLSYLKLGGYSLGMLLNFHAELMKDGITRIVNQYQ